MKLKAIFIHLGAWALLLLYFYTAWLGKNPDRQTLWFNASMIVSRIGQFYFCYLFVYPLFLRKGKVWILLVGILMAYFIFLLLRSTMEEVLYPLWLGFDNYYDGTSIGYYALDNIYYGVPFIFFSAAIYFVQEAFTERKQNSRLKREAQQAELAFLKAQINPHFLYNCLNYLYSLAIPVSESLSNAILRLSELMRYTFHESKDGKVALEDEIHYLESYIALFRMRFDPDFYAQFSCKGIQRQRIAPLLLLPFVENAFKHGETSDAKRPINIALQAAEDRLVFSVSNAISHKQKDQGKGIGNANVQRRLELLYPDRHELLISSNGRTHKITMTIQLH